MTTTTRATFGAALLLALAGAACGDSHGPGSGATVDITGDAPEEAADETADAVCSWSAECGEPSVECGGSSGGDTTCTATIEEVTFSECYDELHPDLLADFRCRDLTAEQEALVNDCINGMVSQDCVTMAELDEYTAALERGEDPAWPLEVPPSCEGLEEVFTGC